jgi:hypothetical protein
MGNSIYLSNDLTLKEKLRIWFKFVNHTKYQRYFEEWYNNLTEGQLSWLSAHF